MMWPAWTVEPDQDIVVMEVDEVFTDEESETPSIPHIDEHLSNNDSNNNPSDISESTHSSQHPAMSSQATNHEMPPPLEQDNERNSVLD